MNHRRNLNEVTFSFADINCMNCIGFLISYVHMLRVLITNNRVFMLLCFISIVMMDVRHYEPKHKAQMNVQLTMYLLKLFR